jgi:LuxR family transcriptional regulator, quorum-sensing system regulator BjaR1
MTRYHESFLEDKKKAYVAFDYIDQIRKINKISELKSAFEAVAKRFGYEHFMVVATQKDHRELLHNKEITVWPDGWLKHYTEQGYIAHDPVPREAINSSLPFTWREVQERYPITDITAQIFNEAREWKMHDGLCIPVRSMDWLQAGITLAGLQPCDDPAVHGALHLMAIYTDSKIRELIPTSSPLHGATCQFSARERECTAWIAAGKSSWEIGQILNLSEDTIRYYIKHAMRKLNVVTRAQLVAEAIRAGEINL